MNKPPAMKAASQSFQRAAEPPKASSLTTKSKATKPFPIRFTEAEMAYLRQKAGRKPVGTYIRERVLGENAEKRRIQHQPRINEKEYAALLAALGQSHLSSNLNQLARAANIGVLDVSPEVEQQLEYAYKAVIAMREALFMALGVKSS